MRYIFCLLFSLAFTTVLGSSAGAQSELEKLLGQCLTNKRTGCEERATSFVRQSNVNEAERLTEVANAAYRDICSGTLPQASGFELLKQTSLAVNVRQAANAIDAEARRCRESTQTAISALEWLPAVGERNLLLSLLLKEQPGCDSRCQQRADSLFDPADLRSSTELVKYATRIIDTAETTEPVFRQTKEQLEIAIRRGSRTEREALQLALIPFLVKLNERTQLIGLIDTLPRKTLKEGPYSNGLGRMVTAFSELRDDFNWDKALSVLDALPATTAREVQRARVLSNLVSCSESCARTAINAIQSEVGDDVTATIAMLRLALKFEQVPVNVFRSALEGGAAQQRTNESDIRRALRITTLAPEDTPKIVSLRKDQGTIATLMAQLKLKNPNGCGRNCYQQAVSDLRPYIGSDYSATVGLAVIVLEDYASRQSESNLVSRGLESLRATNLTQVNKGRVSILKARLAIENPNGCNESCRRSAISLLKPYAGVDIKASMSFADIVLSNYVGFADQKSAAMNGLRNLNRNLLSDEEQGQAAGKFARLLIEDPNGCSGDCEAQAFSSIRPFVGQDAGATLIFADIILSNIFDYEDQIARAVTGIDGLSPSKMLRAQKSRAAIAKATLLLRQPDGCGSSCQNRAFGALDPWAGEDLQASLSYGELILEDYVSRRSRRSKALSGLQSLDKSRLEPSEQGKAASTIARLMIEDPNGCGGDCESAAVSALSPFLGKDVGATEAFAGLVLDNYDNLSGQGTRAGDALHGLKSQQIARDKLAQLATLQARLKIERPKGCSSACANEAVAILDPYLGKVLGPTLAFGRAVLEDGSPLRYKRQQALSALRGLNRDTLKRSEQGQVALVFADILLENPAGCERSCESQAFNALRPYLGKDTATTLGFATRVLSTVASKPPSNQGGLTLTSGSAPINLVLQPSSRHIDRLTALKDEELEVWHDDAISALRGLNTSALTYGERATRGSTLAELRLREPQNCDVPCGREQLGLWRSYVGRDANATIKFAGLIANELTKIKVRRQAILDELEVLRWEWSKEQQIASDLYGILNEEIDPLLPNAQSLHKQALNGLSAIPSSRLTFEQQGQVAASRLALYAARPQSCSTECLDSAFERTRRFLGVDPHTTLRVAGLVLDDNELKRRYQQSVLSGLSGMPRARLDETQLVQFARLRFEVAKGCDTACRKSALSILNGHLGSHYGATILYAQKVKAHFPLEFGQKAIRNLNALPTSDLDIDERIAVATLVAEITELRNCGKDCMKKALDNWANLANQADTAALEYGRQIAGRLDLDQEHVSSALKTLEGVDSQSLDLTLSQRQERLNLIKRLRWQLGKAPERNRLLKVLEANPRLESGMAVSETSEDETLIAAALVRDDVLDCGVQAIEAAITSPSDFRDDMPPFTAIPERCKVAALQAVLTTLGSEAVRDGVYGPVSRSKAVAALKAAVIEKEPGEDFEDWILIELMRANTGAVLPAMDLLRGQ